MWGLALTGRGSVRKILRRSASTGRGGQVVVDQPWLGHQPENDADMNCNGSPGEAARKDSV
jgi:hypothetical protein